MNRIALTRAALLAASIVLVSGAPAGAQDAMPTALALGSKAPMATTKMKSADGKDVSIADVKGAKGTLVVFTCNACPSVFIAVLIALSLVLRVPRRTDNAAQSPGTGSAAISASIRQRRPGETGC